MTDIREYRAWAQSLVRMKVAMRMMDEVPFLGMSPEIRAECKEIRDRMDDLAERMGGRLMELQHELEAEE